MGRPALLATLVLACAQAEDVPAPEAPVPPGPQNLLLISIDTLRADRVGAYGYERPTTPNLDRVAAEGVVFEQAWSQSPWTLPSHASLLTGLYTRAHGLRDDDHRLGREIPVLAELLVEAGYRTAAFVNTPYLSPRTGLLRGFERYEQLERFDASVPAALDFLRSEDPRPFFLLLHTMDVHSPYLPGEDQRRRFVRPYDGELDGRTSTLLRVRRGFLKPEAVDLRHLNDLYDAVIHEMDQRLAPLLAFLDESGLAATTLLIITSDHGEEFLEHGDVLHGRTVYEEMLRVPLLVRGPGVPRGLRVGAPTALVDVMPTMLRAAGVAPPPDLDGRDLRLRWRAPEHFLEAPVFAEVDPRSLSRKPARSLTAVRVGTLKLIHDRELNTSELFDLSSDPDERLDRAAARPEDARQLRELVLDHLRAEGARPEARELTAEQRRQLEELGYAD